MDSGGLEKSSPTAPISFDIEFDDSEFQADLPQVENPTLESILNEQEEDESILEEDDVSVPSSVQLFKDAGDTSSLSSQDSLLSDRPRKQEKLRKSIHYKIHGSVLKPSKLKSISAQLLSAADRVDAGMPTAIVVSSLIAIGTSHGLVLVFDPKQVLKWCLGSTAVGTQYGSVSALGFNKDCTRLLCGFAKGQITMWDLTTGKLLRTIADAHPPGTAVLHIKFTDSLVIAACSDSGGSVFELEFKRLIGVRTCESKCLFSGSRGEGSPGTLPLLAWQFVVIQVSEKDRVIDPVLAFARESTIYFYQVICQNAQEIKCTGLQKIQLQYNLLNITWMNPRTLVAMDTKEKIHVLDVRSEEELEVIDVSEVMLVYNTSHFKSLATGGNRIDVLAKQNKYQDALALALSFYEGNAKAVVGLTGSSAKRKQIVADLMLDMLFDYVKSMIFVQRKARWISIYERQDGRIGGVLYDNSTSLCRPLPVSKQNVSIIGITILRTGSWAYKSKRQLLTNTIKSEKTFQQKDQCRHLIYQNLNHIEPRFNRPYIKSVTLIVHLEVTSLDIHQVVSLCWSHGLYDAIIYVYNQGMRDFTTPLEELLTVLRSAVDTGKQLTDNQIRLGNKLLVYISCCLAGRAYPLGDIPEDHVSDVKNNMFHCITSLHSKNHTSEEPIYPHLRTLLQFDTREFLNVLALAFEEEEFNTEEGIKKRQRVVDILLQVMVENVGFTPTQVGILFTFLARQMARHENTIQVKKVLFEQVLEFLSNPDDESRHEERQQALMELLRAGGLIQIDEERLLYLVENAKFYRVCEMLYEKRRQYDKILSCYLRDYARKYHAFSYITSILNSDRYSSMEKEALKEEALRNLQELVSIDCKQAAQMVIGCFASNLGDICKQLEDTPQILFEFLQGVMSCKDTGSSAIHQDRGINIEPQVFELYIDLMCQFKPNEVLNYIKMNEGYRLEQTLQICRKYKLSEATAFLLEKAGDIQGAFGIILQKLQAKLKLFVEVMQGGNTEKDVNVLFLEIHTLAIVIIQLCQRNSGKMDEASREALWFPLLETVMTPQRKLKDIDNKDVLDDFNKLTHHILNSMMGYIALPAILQKIMQDPAYNTGKFGEVRELILGMLETYNYEQTLMKTCKNLLNHDIHVHLKSLTSAAVRGYIPRGDNCNLCNKLFINQNETDSVVVFRCGHSYHLPCLRSVGSVHVMDGEEMWACYLCSHSKRGRIQSTRFHRSLSHPNQAALQTTKEKSKEMTLDSQHIQAIDAVRKAMKTPSRMAILTELSRSDTRSVRGSSGIFHQENFQLRLAPPIAPTNS
ncbi:VPS8 [Mytilus coruscus]|uniref:VPS8 n=1 Tax=Mytilus coruscus TaxID=42192 RepID=A0A6J8DW85_MYTCO|nr:VPS8 [Mytilus coruscus]